MQAKIMSSKHYLHKDSWPTYTQPFKTMLVNQHQQLHLLENSMDMLIHQHYTSINQLGPASTSLNQHEAAGNPCWFMLDFSAGESVSVMTK